MSALRTALAIFRANMMRLVRDRSNLFFMVLLPLLIVFGLSAAIGGQAEATLVGYVDAAKTPSTQKVVDLVGAAEGVSIKKYDSVAALEGAVARRQVDFGFAIPTAGPTPTPGSTAISWYPPADGGGIGVMQTLQAAATEVSGAAKVEHLVIQHTGRSGHEVRTAVVRASEQVRATPVATEDLGGSFGAQPAQVRAIIALGQVTLFIFMTSLLGATYLLTSRQLGVIRRMRAGPVRAGAIIAGEGASRFTVAMVQAGILLGGSALMGIGFRRLDLIAMLCLVMALVGTAVSMILGAVGRSEQQLSALAVLASLVLPLLEGR